MGEKAFLWTMVVLGVLEMAGTAYYGAIGKVPVRTAKSMAWNGALMFCLGMWAFWIVSRG